MNQGFMLDGALDLVNFLEISKALSSEMGRVYWLVPPPPPSWISGISDLEENLNLIYGAQ